MRARGADGLPVLQAAHIIPHHLFVSERRPAVALALGYGKDKAIILSWIIVMIMIKES
jgi:hypothetical protein